MDSTIAFSKPSATELRFERRFAGDRATLWALWTRAEHLRHWWGPQGFTLPICEVDFQPGGVWFYCMQDQAGARYCGKMTYIEIDAPRRFSATDAFTDEAGAVNAAMPIAHSEFEFLESAGETLVRGSSRYDTREARDRTIDMGVEAGLSQTLERLAQYLSSLAD